MSPAIEPVPGDYHGRPTHRLASAHVWVDVLAEAGPWIVRLGLAGSDANLLAETPDLGWDTPYGRYQLFGGHRLWFAPEGPERVAVPDDRGLRVVAEPDGLPRTGLAEPTGMVRSIVVRLDPDAAALEVCHELWNDGPRCLELAPWSITQLPLGGAVLLPQAAAATGHAVRPNRSLVLWPYTSWEDPRLQLRDGLIVVRADAGPSLKIGYFNRAGWVAYRHGDVAVVRRFEPAADRAHPDLGCNVETYCGPRFLELEVLGPLTEIGPGETVALSERWEVLVVRSGSDDGDHPGRGGDQPDERATDELRRIKGDLSRSGSAA